MQKPVYIIAEAGINHNGSLELAFEMIDEAKKAGADCVKFQTFKASEFCSDKDQMFTYKSQGKEVTESMLKMFERYEFSEDEWRQVISHCKKVGIDFSSTAQNPSDLDFLLSLTDLPFIKVGSDDLTNLDLMRFYAGFDKPMIISTGMAFAYEIDDAIRAVREISKQELTVLHCISCYPTEDKDVHLKKIQSIKEAFGVKVGFSDHTIGSTAAVGSVCFGAEVIEKHFTLSHDLPGPDHWFSINKEELYSYVKDIRYIENAIGQSKLGPTPHELSMRDLARRKVVFKENFSEGKKLTKDDFSFKRGEGDHSLAPREVKFVIGRTLLKSAKANEVVTLEHFQ